MKLLTRLTNQLARIEAGINILLITAIVILIMTNVITRSSGNAIYWIDELVIYLMIWMVFMCFPLLIHLNQHIAVDVVTSMLSQPVAQALKFVSESIILVISLLLLYFSALWFGPFDLISSGFDLDRFVDTTFNFIYQEPTNTLRVGKYLFWLAVPVSALLCAIHSFNNLLSFIGSAGKSESNQ